MISKCTNCGREYDIPNNSSINCACGAKVYNKTKCSFKKTPIKEIKGYVKKFKIKKRDTVIDAGAYIGEFAAFASKLVGKGGKVICFEPNPDNYKELIKNTNNLTNVTTINKGLWSEDKVLKLRMMGMASTFFHVHGWPVKDMPVVSLDNALKELKIKKVNFIKMDIEGAEIHAVMGCEKLLKDNDVKLAIASYNGLMGGKTALKLKNN